MKAEKNLRNNTSIENMTSKRGTPETQPKKPYNAPQLIEHGSVEQITGAPPVLGNSGLAGVCWIAAAVFEENLYLGPRVNLVRRWLVNDYEKSGPMAMLVMGLYRTYGERVAKVVEKNSILKHGFRKLFDRALAKAEEKYASR